MIKSLLLLLMLGIGSVAHGAAFLEPTGGLAAPVATQPSLVGLHIGTRATANKFINGAGQIVQLRGVDQDGAEYMCNSSTVVFDPTGPATPANIVQLQSWAVNAVRLPLNEQCPLGINGMPANYSAATYLAAVETYVTQLNAAGIVVILDLQWVGAGTTPANGSTNQVPMPDADHAPAFWTTIASDPVFKSNPMVIFDLYNEPFPDSNGNTTAAWTCLRDGGMGTTAGGSGTCPGVSQGGVFYNAAGMQSLVNAIRATGATNVIDVPGVQYSNALSQWLAYEPTDPTPTGFGGTWHAQLAAAWHSYNDQICSNLTCWTNTVLPVINAVPVNSEEIGEHDCQGVYITPLMTWLDTHGAGYMGWSWNVYNCSGIGSGPSLIAQTSPVVPTGLGYPLEVHLLQQAGLPPPTPPVVPFFSSVYPFGISVGYTGTNNYSASDGTLYYPDVQTTGLTIQVTNPYQLTAFTSSDTFTGTPDPHLYQTGREGCCGIYTINVPNGNYYVTIGMAQNSTYNSANTALGPWGQDQILQGNQVASCQFSSYSGDTAFTQNTISAGGASITSNVLTTIDADVTGPTIQGNGGQIVTASGGSIPAGTYIASADGTGTGTHLWNLGNKHSTTIPNVAAGSLTWALGTACPYSPVVAPAIDQVQTVTYSVSVFNQQLAIQTNASFGGGRATILNSIKVAQAP